MEQQHMPNILVVNDDSASLMAMVGLVNSWTSEIAYNVLTAQSGAEALRHVLSTDIAVILLDVNMPGMDGFETAEAIHLRPRSSSIPIIFVTAYHADELDRLKGYQKGAVDYLFTPIIPQILKAKLSVFVGMAKTNIELKDQASALDRRTKELLAINARLEVEINERKIAEQKNKTKDDFLAMLGHELRNPLSAIVGAASIINSTGARAEAAEQAKRIIERQSMHLSHIVDDLLDLSRILEGKVQLDKRRLEVAGLVESCIDSLRIAGRTESHNINIQTEQVWVNADPTRLEQIITNVLDNALKYTPAGGYIEIAVRSSKNEVEISISDSGMGMDDALLVDAFEIFVQGDRTPDRSQGGLGIGLALVKKLIALHEGSVTAESKGRGHGSTIRLKLPVCIEDQNDSLISRSIQTGDQYTILLIEDNHDAREMTSMLLSHHGHTVVSAAEGISGIQMAIQRIPDIVVIDIGLPGIDGYETARRLKANSVTKAVPLIALSGYGAEQDKERAITAGFNMHLVKPVNLEKLLIAIQACVSAPLVFS